MNTIHTTIISGFLAVVLLCGGGGATKAYTPDEDHIILVHDSSDINMLARIAIREN